MMQKKEKQSVLWKHRTKKWVVFVAIAAVCIPAVVAVFQLKPEAEHPGGIEESSAKGMVVSICSVEPKTCSAIITAFGEVVPQRQVTVKSQVEGQVIFLSDRLETGNQVRKGELLVRLEQSGYRLQVAEAKNRLAAAEIDVMKEEREAKDALANWQQSGLQGEPASLLVLREPQLAAARSEMEAAKASLLYAQAMLKHTEIRAPFAAVVISRNINSGEMLFATDSIATIFGTERVEIRIHMAPHSWALLPESVRQAKVTLFDTGQSASWQAAVVGKSYNLDGQSRLRTLILQVDHPLDRTPPLLPGTFVRAEITGRPIPHLLRIPESALTQEGLVWFVDNTKRLRKNHVEPLFYDNGFVSIPVPKRGEKGPLQVAISPNASFVEGLVVQPLSERETSDD